MRTYIRVWYADGRDDEVKADTLSVGRGGALVLSNTIDKGKLTEREDTVFVASPAGYISALRVLATDNDD